jgi:CheY-like chemotaxis protein
MAEPQLVLVVDDNEAERTLYGKILWYNGFNVAFATEGEEALRVARERRPDAVVLDLMMPGMDGVELCRRLKADPLTREIPVLALTARREWEMGQRMREAGCARYLEKPIPPLDVFHEVESLIGRPPSPGEAEEPDQDEGSDPQEGPDRSDRRGAPAPAEGKAHPPLSPPQRETGMVRLRGWSVPDASPRASGASPTSTSTSTSPTSTSTSSPGGRGGA